MLVDGVVRRVSAAPRRWMAIFGAVPLLFSLAAPPLALHQVIIRCVPVRA